MEGFTFYSLDHRTPKDLRYDEFKEQDRLFLAGLRETIQSGAGLSRILQHREKSDLIFISAFRTGKDPNEGGYKFYADGEVDSLGISHTSKDSVSRKENKRRNKTLAKAIHKLGYGFIQVEGQYGSEPEESYCVVNHKEDTQDFIFNLSQLARAFDQDSILVAPKGSTPFFYKYTGEKTFLTDDFEILSDAVENYTRIKGHDFRFNIVSEGVCGWRDSLHPPRNRMEVLIPINSRKELLIARNADFLAKQMR